MESFISTTQLKDRRRQLQRQRRLGVLKALWRSVAIASLAGGLFWGLTLPRWAIRSQAQIEVSGNRFLSTEAILALLPETSPPSLMQLDPDSISGTLETSAPIERVRVVRQLVPPRLKVEVVERQPVARTRASTVGVGEGFLDDRGVWTPSNSYHSEQALAAPALDITGFDPQYRPYWQELYQGISRSTVQIAAVDWRDPTNAILETELGSVHLGADPSRIWEQLTVLARLRPLGKQIDLKQVEYIDLKDPNAPTLRLKATP